MATKVKKGLFLELVKHAPYMANHMRRAEYYGVTAVQSPDAWCRVGPTWRNPTTDVWFVAGPGLARWGTSEGLAQIGVSTAPSPTWHAVNLSMTPKPNIAFAVADHVLEQSGHMETVKQLAREAEDWIKAGCP